MKLYRRLFLISLFGFLGFVGLAALKPHKAWLSCYDRKENAIHFQALGTKSKNGDTCLGATKYRASKAFKLIENVSESDDGFSESRAGTKRTVVLKNGRRLLVSQWSGMGKSNQILVLEPNLVTHRVTKLCSVENFSDAFSARVNEKTGKIMLQITKPTDKAQKHFSRLWQACEI